MTAGMALDELRDEIKRTIKEARFWGPAPEGLKAGDRAVRLFRCYQVLRAG